MEKTDKYHKTELELRDALVNQVKALDASTAAYDAGEYWEASRLAATAYILVCDGKRSKSLFSLLGILDNTPFHATASGHALLPLTRLAISVDTWKAHYEPLLDSIVATRSVQRFENWSSRVVISSDDTTTQQGLTRREVIEFMRNKMGGGHVDRSITKIVFEATKTPDPMKISIRRAYSLPDKSDDDNVIIEGIYHATEGASATMRQIAWELRQTLKDLGY